MKKILLTQGKTAIVDDDDYEKFGHLKWCASNEHGKWYATRRPSIVNGRKTTLKLHRAIMQPPKGYEVDHIDGDGLNCAKGNMRVCRHIENLRNVKKHADGISIYKGVSWSKRDQKWYSRIYIRGHNRYLGSFFNEADAAIAYDAKASFEFGDFAKLNFGVVKNER